jgi:hypothetical protein
VSGVQAFGIGKGRVRARVGVGARARARVGHQVAMRRPAGLVEGAGTLLHSLLWRGGGKLEGLGKSGGERPIGRSCDKQTWTGPRVNRPAVGQNRTRGVGLLGGNQSTRRVRARAADSCRARRSSRSRSSVAAFLRCVWARIFSGVSRTRWARTVPCGCSLTSRSTSEVGFLVLDTMG